MPNEIGKTRDFKYCNILLWICHMPAISSEHIKQKMSCKKMSCIICLHEGNFAKMQTFTCILRYIN